MSISNQEIIDNKNIKLNRFIFINKILLLGIHIVISSFKNA